MLDSGADMEDEDDDPNEFEQSGSRNLKTVHRSGTRADFAYPQALQPYKEVHSTQLFRTPYVTPPLR